MTEVIGFIGGMGAQEMIVVFVLFIPLILGLVALVQCLSANFAQGTEKLVWVIVLLALPILGPILWWTIGAKKILR